MPSRDTEGTMNRLKAALILLATHELAHVD
jgi:hypothetical protein